MGLTKVSFAMIEGAFVNVLDFGADPTGSADSTAAIQAAIDSLPGLDEPMVLVGNAPGGTVFIPAGEYKITAPLIVSKSNTTIQGEGSANSILKYGGAGTISEILKFYETNYSALYGVCIDGNESSSTVGADACIQFDLAAFFSCSDVYLLNSLYNGIRASHLWESYFENIQIRNTGRYAAAGGGKVTGGAIRFTAYGSTSTLFSGHECNNTVFNKITLSPYGACIRDEVGDANMTFNDVIVEQNQTTAAYFPSGNTYPISETRFAFVAATRNLVINGGYAYVHDSNTGITAKLFDIVQTLPGLSINNFYVANTNANAGLGYVPVITPVLVMTTGYPSSITNFTVRDTLGSLVTPFKFDGAYTTDGSINYICEDVERTLDELFYSASSKLYFTGTFNKQTVTGLYEYNFQKLGVETSIASADSPYSVTNEDKVILVDMDGNVTIDVADIVNSAVTIKRTGGGAQTLTVINTGSTIDNAASYSMPNIWDAVTIYRARDGRAFILNTN